MFIGSEFDIAMSADAHQPPRLPRQGRLPPVHIHHGPALASGAHLPRRHGAGCDPNIELSWMEEEILGIHIGHLTKILCQYRLLLPGLRHSAFKRAESVPSRSDYQQQHDPIEGA